MPLPPLAAATTQGSACGARVVLSPRARVADMAQAALASERVTTPRGRVARGRHHLYAHAPSEQHTAAGRASGPLRQAMDEAAPLSCAPDAAPLALPAPDADASAALVPHSPHTVAALARSRYEAPVLPAVLPRADAQLFRPLLAATAPGAAAAFMGGGPDGGHPQQPRGARAAPRPPRGSRATAAGTGSPLPRKRRGALTRACSSAKRRAQPFGEPAGNHFTGAAGAGRAPLARAGARLSLSACKADPGG